MDNEVDMSVECPRCEGRKGGQALVNRGGDCTLEWVDCHTCGGDGEVSEEQARAIEAGEAMRHDRVERRVSLREEATRLGITPRELSDIEFGRQA